jgi:hypothetical protein
MIVLKTGPRRPPIKELIMSRVEFIPECGCWIWMGSASGDGEYGRIRFNGKNWNVHRLLWEIENGPIPDGLILCHRCDIGFCCNPKHLFLGTNQDNTNDKIKKGRQPRGEESGGSKLLSSEVIFIRDSTESAIALAQKYHVDDSTIHAIRNRKYWKHL